VPNYHDYKRGPIFSQLIKSEENFLPIKNEEERIRTMSPEISAERVNSGEILLINHHRPKAIKSATCRYTS